MDKYVEKALSFGFERWHSRTGLVLVLAGILVVGVSTFAGIDLAQVSLIEWLLLVFILLVVSGIWFITRVERVPAKFVGFGVAIEYEHSDQAKQLKSDFVVTLRDLLGRSTGHRLKLVDYQSLAKRITNEEEALWLCRKANLRFLLFGRARARKSQIGPSHVLDLSWMVVHIPIAKERSTEFAKDVSPAFPRRMILSEGNMFVCEVAAKQTDAFARYVIATAAALSEDFVYAEELLKHAEARLQQYVNEGGGTPFTLLLGKVRTRLEELYALWLNQLSHNYYLKRDKAILATCESIVKKLREYDPNNYSARLSAAMAAFMLRRDIAAAKAEINACRAQDNATWMYSDAFLEAYEGNLEKAYHAYRRAFYAPLEDPTLPTQCEEFIQLVLDEEPDRVWLHYCLGLINYRAKEDFEAARADFQRFIDTADPVRFARDIEYARKWLAKIDARLAA